MGATKNLGLTQFEPDTVTNWLDQYNKDMKKIDDYVGDENVAGTALEERLTTDETNIENNRNQINENTQDIANILNDISEIEGGESGASLKTLNDRIAEVETGLQTATTDITTVANKANATATEVETIDSRVETVEDDVSGLSGVVGNSPLLVGKTITSLIGNTPINDDVTITEILDSIWFDTHRNGVKYMKVNIGSDNLEIPISIRMLGDNVRINATMALPELRNVSSIELKTTSKQYSKYRTISLINNRYSCLQIGDSTYGTMRHIFSGVSLNKVDDTTKEIVITIPIGVDMQTTILSLYADFALGY